MKKQGFLIKKYIIWLCGDKIGLVGILERVLGYSDYHARDDMTVVVAVQRSSLLITLWEQRKKKRNSLPVYWGKG